MPKRTAAAKIACGFFDQPDLGSLKTFRFVLSGLAIEILGIWGHVIYSWKGLGIPFSTVCCTTPEFLKFHLQNEKEKSVVI